MNGSTPRPAPSRRRHSGASRPEKLNIGELAGEPVLAAFTRAPGNDADIGGLKVVAANGWFAARPSGTEEIYKIYAESFLDEGHLRRIEEEAVRIVNAAFAAKRGPVAP